MKIIQQRKKEGGREADGPAGLSSTDSGKKAYYWYFRSCVPVCVCLSLCIRVYLWVSERVCDHVCICVSVWLCMYVYVQLCMLSVCVTVPWPRRSPFKYTRTHFTKFSFMGKWWNQHRIKKPLTLWIFIFLFPSQDLRYHNVHTSIYWGSF